MHVNAQGTGLCDPVVDNQAKGIRMRNIVIVLAAALALASCQTARQDRALTGAAIGGAAGAIVGGVAGKSGGAAVAGGVIGAATGAIIADATRPGRCYYRDRRGKKVYVRCR